MTKVLSFAAIFLLTSIGLAGVNVVYSDYDSALGQIKLDNACITATQVKTIKPVEVCTQLVPITHEGHGEDTTVTSWVCTNKVISHLTVSRAFQRSVCLEFSYEADNMVCVKTGAVNDFVPAVIKISTAKNVYSSSTNWPGVVSYITLPACN